MTRAPEQAATFIRTGAVVAFPTETVYGLGADAFNVDAVRKIFEAKERPDDNPLIVHVAEQSDVLRVVRSISGAGKRLMEHFFPGPLTIVLPRHGDLPDEVTAGLDTVGVRMPNHPVARAFLSACGCPVAAPSANRSGRPSTTTWQAVLEDLDGRIPCILRSGRSPVGLESTVVDCTVDPPLVLRLGAVSMERLRSVEPEACIVAKHEGSQGTHLGSPAARSPGMRHRHYVPAARVVLFEAATDIPPARQAGYIGLDAIPPDRVFPLAQQVPTVEAYAYELFDFMRRCDAAGLDTIYCQRVVSTGIGRAIMDRLNRAGDG